MTKRCARPELKVTNLLARLEEQNATLLTHNASLTQRILVLENEVLGLNDKLSSARLPETLPPCRPTKVADSSVQIESVRTTGNVNDNPPPLRLPAPSPSIHDNLNRQYSRYETSHEQMAPMPSLDDSCPGLPEHETMLNQFSNVVSYTNYRLTNRKVIATRRETETLARTKKSVDGLYPRLDPFTGKKPITLLSFLATLREGFNHLYVSEAIAVSLISFYLEGTAKNVYTA